MKRCNILDSKILRDSVDLNSKYFVTLARIRGFETTYASDFNFAASVSMGSGDFGSSFGWIIFGSSVC